MWNFSDFWSSLYCSRMTLFSSSSLFVFSWILFKAFQIPSSAMLDSANFTDFYRRLLIFRRTVLASSFNTFTWEIVCYFPFLSFFLIIHSLTTAGNIRQTTETWCRPPLDPRQHQINKCLGYKVHGSKQFPALRCWWVIIATLCHLMPQSWYQKAAQLLVSKLLSCL